MDSERILDLQGVAAIAITSCQMAQTDQELDAAIRWAMQGVGVSTRAEMLLVAEAIAAFPQPADESADERERRRPIEEMLGVLSPEGEVSALLRAREHVLRIADTLEDQGLSE